MILENVTTQNNETKLVLFKYTFSIKKILSTGLFELIGLISPKQFFPSYIIQITVDDSESDNFKTKCNLN